MVNSDTILGRSLNRAAFERGKPYRISVYCTHWGRVRYSDPVVRKPKASVLYRIIVHPRGALGEREPVPRLVKPARSAKKWRSWKAYAYRKIWTRKEQRNA